MTILMPDGLSIVVQSEILNKVVNLVEVNVSIRRTSVQTTLTVVAHDDCGQDHNYIVQDVESENFSVVMNILRQAEDIARHFDVPIQSNSDIKEAFQYKWKFRP